MKKKIFCNISTPDLSQLASRSGHKLTDAGYTNDRRHAVKLDGKKMAASEARKTLLDQYDFITFNNAPCNV